MKLTNKEITDILKKVNYPSGLTFGQAFLVFLWTIFNKKKFYIFIEKLKNGMSLKFAYNNTRKNEKIQ
jgi:hypothetical protein